MPLFHGYRKTAWNIWNISQMLASVFIWTRKDFYHGHQPNGSNWVLCGMPLWPNKCERSKVMLLSQEEMIMDKIPPAAAVLYKTSSVFQWSYTRTGFEHSSRTAFLQGRRFHAFHWTAAWAIVVDIARNGQTVHKADLLCFHDRVERGCKLCLHDRMLKTKHTSPVCLCRTILGRSERLPER